MCVAVLATALGIWFVGSMVDFVRAKLFELLHVDRLCDWLGGHMDRLLGNVAEARMGNISMYR